MNQEMESCKTMRPVTFLNGIPYTKNEDGTWHPDFEVHRELRDRRKIERREAQRGVTIRHDDEDYIPKRIRWNK